MCIKIGTELQCLEGEDQKTDVYKNRTRKQVLGMITSEFQSI